MRVHIVSFSLSLLAFTGACAPAVQISGAVAPQAPDCIANAGGPARQEGLLDLGFDPTRAFSYTAALVVDTDAEDITFEAVEVYFGTDADRGDELQLRNAGTPTSQNTARRTSVSATSASDVVFAQLVTVEDAAALAAEPFVSEQLVDVEARARIVAFARLVGTTSSGVSVSSQELPFPIELCRGCLVPQCSDGEVAVPLGCALGQDAPAICQ